LEIKRSVLVPYSAHDMFDLIEQAENYPQFLPWCTGATILERSDEWVAARIEFTYLKFRFGFQTRNPKRRPEWLQVRLVEGPFRHFQAEWLLTPLADIGCKINFAVSYEIIDGVFDRLAAQAVEVVTRSMVDAFVKRAEQTLPEFAPAQNGAERQEQTREQPPAQSEAAAPVAASATLPDGAPALPPRETAMTTPDTAVFEALRKSRLAQDLTAEQTQVLASVVSLATFRANDILAVEGTTDNHLYEVVEGSLGVVKHRGTPDETVLVTLQPRDFAHELGFLDGAQRFASLVATTDARVLVLERTGLESLIDTHPRIVYRVMCAIVQTVHRIQTRLSMHATELTNYIVKQHGRY
jgi:ribosome-associated toxin RatA of RatAB toxin-antitoxin module/CRP-like cAMP-binding protein